MHGNTTYFFSFPTASVLPIDQVVSWAHDVGAKVLVDACQSVPHMVVDVKSLDADFMVASSHKVKSSPSAFKLKFITLCVRTLK